MFEQRGVATKNCTVSRLKARSSFLYPSTMCLLDFWTRKSELSLFFGDKSDAVWLDEKQHGGTKQWTPRKKFEIPSTWNCKRITANCSLRFPMKNLKLKVSNEHHVYGKRQTWICTTWPKQSLRLSIFSSTIPLSFKSKKFNKVILPL